MNAAPRIGISRRRFVASALLSVTVSLVASLG
jgi:hypothetical protein